MREARARAHTYEKEKGRKEQIDDEGGIEQSQNEESAGSESIRIFIKLTKNITN